MKPIPANFNLQLFPRIVDSMEIAIVVPTSSKPGSLIFFNPNDIFVNSEIVGIKFNSAENCNRVTYSENRTATDADALNACITLVEDPEKQTFKGVPVSVLNSKATGKYSNGIRKFARKKINIVKSYLTWTGASPAKNLYFYFTIYYIPK